MSRSIRFSASRTIAALIGAALIAAAVCLQGAGAALAADPPLPKRRPPIPDAAGPEEAARSRPTRRTPVADGLHRKSSGNRVFDMVDRDGNFRLTWREAADERVQRFDLLDGDGDGRLSETEFVERPGLGTKKAHDLIVAQRTAQFAAMDENRDGSVDREEYVEAGRPIFRTMDSNDDGAVTPEEFAVRVER